jgi:hypothetical protein
MTRARDLANLADSAVGIESAWTSYTPTISGGSVGNGTLTSFYKQIGKTVFVRFKFTLGSTSTVNGFQISRPVTSVTVPSTSMIGLAGLRDAGVAGYVGTVADYDTTKFYVTNLKTDSTYAGPPEIGTTTPFTWGTGDEIAFTCVYEAA